FKDITRIASSSPKMWQNICLTNAKVIKNILDKYIDSLKNASNALSSMDAEYLYNMFDTAGEYRNSIPSKSIGLFHRIFEIYVDIVDEAGSIATIAALLAENHINIKNIGIIHNREFEEGVLRIEFYDEKSEDEAKSLLRKHNYHVYDR
ncbi:MAG TPA: prephenate dehydrogenase/arogenate dehydrogenase family protein, partial [Clostridiales bacterium]|nr:prephenate dehydrogenase/arogenate dehydrogenase family protein [Clostridiales bacterium]